MPVVVTMVESLAQCPLTNAQYADAAPCNGYEQIKMSCLSSRLKCLKFMSGFYPKIFVLIYRAIKFLRIMRRKINCKNIILLQGRGKLRRPSPSSRIDSLCWCL